MRLDSGLTRLLTLYSMRCSWWIAHHKSSRQWHCSSRDETYTGVTLLCLLWPTLCPEMQSVKCGHVVVHTFWAQTLLWINASAQRIYLCDPGNPGTTAGHCAEVAGLPLGQAKDLFLTQEPGENKKHYWRFQRGDNQRFQLYSRCWLHQVPVDTSKWFHRHTDDLGQVQWVTKQSKKDISMDVGQRHVRRGGEAQEKEEKRDVRGRMLYIHWVNRVIKGQI